MLAVSLIIMSAVAVADEPASWDPQTLARESTLEFLTVGPQEGEHWSRVWVVEVDDQLYVRLGRRAATRFQKNTTAPFVKMRISDHEFDHVRADPAPEMAERGAAAMAAKYWSDLLIRFARHPAAGHAPAMKSPNALAPMRSSSSGVLVVRQCAQPEPHEEWRPPATVVFPPLVEAVSYDESAMTSKGISEHR